MQYGRTVILGLVLAGLLVGCASVQQNEWEQVGLPTADNPEYLGHPFRAIGLLTYFSGNLLQYVVVEPAYFALNTIPNAVGLSLTEQRYLHQRQEAWSQAFKKLETPAQP